MRRLLEADLRRVAGKILPWVLIVLSLIWLTISLWLDIDDSADRTYFFLDTVMTKYSFVSLVIGFSALMGIYADEFKSMVMIGVIGHGLSREKFVLAKFVDLCLLTLQMQMLALIYVLILKAAYGIDFSSAQTKFFVLMFVTAYIDTIAFVSIAAIFYFLSENAVIGMVAFLAFELVIPLTLIMFGMFSSFAVNHLEKYYVSGLLSSAGSDFILGDYTSGILNLLFTIVVYVFGSLALTILIFRRKELEF